MNKNFKYLLLALPLLLAGCEEVPTQSQTRAYLIKYYGTQEVEQIRMPIGQMEPRYCFIVRKGNKIIEVKALGKEIIFEQTLFQ